MEKIKVWQGHKDYIRSIDVHPNEPYILSGSDDFLIKLWNWDKDFICIREFESHSHFVMQVQFNPQDPSLFASASLDKTIKMWDINTTSPHFTLSGHTKGVNCLNFYPSGDKPYLVTGADDKTAKIWDYQTKTCVQTLEGHTDNVVTTVFHPKLPLLLTGSEDGTVRIWHSTTFRLETTLNYGMERVWTIGVHPTSSLTAIGYDDGTVVVKLGNDNPIISMDKSGKILWADNTDILSGNLKGLFSSSNVNDGDALPIVSKDLGKCELYPQYLSFNSNGHFFLVYGDGEYTIYTGRALRSKCYGPAIEAVWALGGGDYAIRENSSQIKCYHDFNESNSFSSPSSIEKMFGGVCLGIQCDGFILFYDWDNCKLIRRIDVQCKNIYWSESGDLVVLACQDSFYILHYDKNNVNEALKGEVSNEGIEGSFELLYEISDNVKSGLWVGDCFLFTNKKSLNYCVGDTVINVTHLQTTEFILGYLAKENRIYLVDKQKNIISYEILSTFLDYQTCVYRKEFDEANELLESIPENHYDKVARFLEGQGYKEEAYAVVKDPDHKFSLAIELNKLDDAEKMIESKEFEGEGEQESIMKWKQLSDLALSRCNIKLSEHCAKKANDYSALLLLYTSTGNKNGLIEVGNNALNDKEYNTAFISFLTAGMIDKCIDVLLANGKIPEACLFAKTYNSNRIQDINNLWKQALKH